MYKAMKTTTAKPTLRSGSADPLATLPPQGPSVKHIGPMGNRLIDRISASEGLTRRPNPFCPDPERLAYWRRRHQEERDARAPPPPTAEEKVQREAKFKQRIAELKAKYEAERISTSKPTDNGTLKVARAPSATARTKTLAEESTAERSEASEVPKPKRPFWRAKKMSPRKKEWLRLQCHREELLRWEEARIKAEEEEAKKKELERHPKLPLLEDPFLDDTVEDPTASTQSQHTKPAPPCQPQAGCQRPMLTECFCPANAWDQAHILAFLATYRTSEHQNEAVEPVPRQATLPPQYTKEQLDRFGKKIADAIRDADALNSFLLKVLRTGVIPEGHVEKCILMYAIDRFQAPRPPQDHMAHAIEEAIEEVYQLVHHKRPHFQTDVCATPTASLNLPPIACRREAPRTLQHESQIVVSHSEWEQRIRDGTRKRAERERRQRPTATGPGEVITDNTNTISLFGKIKNWASNAWSSIKSKFWR